MKDLFNLADDDENGTETGDIFLGTSAKELTASKAGNGKEPSQTESEQKSSNDMRRPEDGSATLLNTLLEDSANGQLLSTMNHDEILGAGSDVKDISMLEYEAQKVAREAMDELKRSARRRRREGIGVPTWTGKSGLAGYTAKSSANGNSKAASLLSKIKQREGAGNSTTGETRGETVSATTVLLQNLVEFLRDRGGQCSSAQVVERFRSRVGSSPEALQEFKSLLKQIAVLTKGAGPGGTAVWKLNEDIED